MSWTYEYPQASPLDAVRFYIQDIDEEAQLLQDEEVLFALETEAGYPTTPEPKQGSILSAAAACMEALAMRFAAQADVVAGSLRATYTKQAAGYNERAKELRLRATNLNAPWTGGQLTSEREARISETGTLKPDFTRKQFQMPWSGGPRLGDEELSGFNNEEER